MYDVAVLGVGTMGSFTCLELARRGLRVVGVDRWSPPHGSGSHSGQTRVFREAYAEHPDYVPLAVLAGKLWEKHGREAGLPLLTRCGQMSIGAPDSALVAGVLRSAEQYGVPVQLYTARELEARYSMVHVDEGEVGAFEPGAGWIDVDQSLRFALRAAQASGAELRLGTAVERWEATGEGVTVYLANGETLKARRLIVCAGAWSSEMLHGLALPLRVVRKALVWLRPRPQFVCAAESLPVLSFAKRILYSFPARDGLFKVAVHATDESAQAHPEEVAEANPADIDEVVREVTRYLRETFGDEGETRERIAEVKTCLYTMTPDEHFFLDAMAGQPVCIAAGFSGHGFKFAPAIGRILAEMSLGLSVSAPVDFLSTNRLRGVGIATA